MINKTDYSNYNSQSFKGLKLSNKILENAVQTLEKNGLKSHILNTYTSPMPFETYLKFCANHGRCQIKRSTQTPKPDPLGIRSGMPDFAVITPKEGNDSHLVSITEIEVKMKNILDEAGIFVEKTNL